MIKSMERRFTAVAILVISTVLLVLLVTVNAIAIRSNIRRVDNALENLGFHVKDQNMMDFERDKDIGLEGSKSPPGEFGPPAHRDENRSFEVILDSDGEMVVSSAGPTNTIDESSALDLARGALEDGRIKGFADEFRYLVIEGDASTRVVFLDYSFEKRSEQNFILVSIGVYFLAVILVAGLVRVFLKPVMKPIREAYIKQRRFITDASHELKTPLTVIATNMQLIEMESCSSKWTTSVNNQVERLKALSNDLVVLSRMEETDLLTEMRGINLSDLVNDVAMGFEPAIEAAGKTFNCKIEEDIKIKGNYDSLEKVMSVLMNNAMKYSKQNGTVEVSLHKNGKNAEIKVANTTDTIEKGNHSEYFERFYRGDKSRNSETGGFGIGLAVAKSTVEDHKGKIKAISSDGKSLEVTISLKRINYEE